MPKGEHKVTWSDPKHFSMNLQLPETWQEFAKEVGSALYSRGVAPVTQSDVMSGFRKRAMQLGVHPKRVWATDFLQHVDMAVKYCQGTFVNKQDIEDYMVGIAAYAYLLWAESKEEKA